MSETKQTPETQTSTAVEFSLSASSHPFVRASMGGGQAVLEELVPRGGGEYAEYLTVVGIEPEAVVALMDDLTAVEVDLLVSHADSGLFDFLVGETCPVVFLCLVGAVPRKVESTNGRGSITAEVPSSTDPSTVIRRFRSAYPDAELAIKRQQSTLTPRFGPREFPPTIEELLTDRQHEVLDAAFEAGYYNWSREATGEEIAESIGISPATFHQHLRVAERYLVEWFLMNRPSPESDEANRQALFEQ